MELQDKPPSAQESLQLIEKFIANTRFNMRKFAFSIILFGILIPVAALLQYFLIVFVKYELSWLPWPILMTGGFIFTMFHYARLSKNEGIDTLQGLFFRSLFVWGGLSYFLLAFLCGALQINPVCFMLALTSLLIGVSGLALRYPPLLWGGVLFFIAAIVCVYLTPLNQLLLMAFCVISGYLIPGILLTRQKEAS